MDSELAASSLVLTVMAILFGAWNDDLNAVGDLPIASKRPDRRPQKRRIWWALLTRSAPLTAGAWAIMLIFLPHVLQILSEAIRDGSRVNDVEAAFAVTEGFTLVVAVSAAIQLLRIVGKAWAAYFSA